MNLPLLTTTAAIAAIMIPGVAAASSGERGIKVCSRMFMASLPHPEAASPTFRIELLNNGHVDTEKQYAAGEITYDLRAVDAGIGREVAAAACTVNEDGAVIAMLLEPRAAGAPSLADKF